MGLIVCPDCAGMGDAVESVKRYKSGSIRTIVFDLKKTCATCAGTGKAFTKSGVVYSGRPDIKKSEATQ